jgi:NAD(P)-dependent dehydrogenase (short-subunit alcohol dehydrogenase family)
MERENMTRNRSTSLDSRQILITGGTRGIGLYTAMGLAQKGAHVIIVGHNADHGEDAVRKINEQAGPDAVRFIRADLSVMAEIRELGEKVLEETQSVDVLVNNVGGFFRQRRETADGLEMTFALNHISYFLLTGLLLPHIRRSEMGRIVNVSSDAHRQAQMDFDDLQFEERYPPFKAYARTKLENLLFTYELDRRLGDEGVTVNALHPGFVNSKLYRHMGILTPLVDLFAWIAGKSSEEGAETPIYLAGSPDVSDISGKYFVDREMEDSSPASYDQGDARRLWEISESLTGFAYP